MIPNAECTNASGGCFTADACLFRCANEKTKKTKQRKIPITYLHKNSKLENGRWVDWFEPREVYVMAIAEGYAMVKRKGCAPYIIKEKDLPL